MICLTATPHSRQLAKVDLLNASMQGDVVELCLDHLIKEPDFKDLIGGVSKPLIVSCRREADGGAWRHDEDFRRQWLRNAIVEGPDYVELDPETAKAIPPFGQTQRIVSQTSLDAPLTDAEAAYNEAVGACKADIVKFVARTETLEEARALLAAVSKKRDKPVVGVGVGRSSRMLQILGARYGAHWVYAALEPEMAAYPGDATLFELDEVYDVKAIGSGTKFVAMVGFPHEAESIAVRVFNAGFRELDLAYRCLPVHVGRTDGARDTLERLRIRALVVHPEASPKAFSLGERIDKAARRAQAADLVFQQQEGWTAYNVFSRNVRKALETAIGDGSGADEPLGNRNVLVLGSGGVAQSVVFGLEDRAAVVSLSAPDDADAQQLASLFGARHVPFTQLYDTLADVVVLADPKLSAGHRRHQLNPGFLRESMTVLDVSKLPFGSPFLEEARTRGARIVNPADVFAEQLRVQFESITGAKLPEAALASLQAT